MPDSDFFSYIDEGRRLLSNPLTRVVSPPLYSVIVYLFEALLPIRHAGVVGGTVFNIFCFVASLWFLWKLSKQWLGWFGLLPVILLSVNPLAFFVNLQPLNLPLATLFVLMAMYYNEKRPVFSYVLALTAFFSRPEAACILVVFLVRDLVMKKRAPHLGWLIVALFVVAAWYLRPMLDAQKSDYLAEIVARKNEIPNVAFLRNSFAIAPFLTLSQDSINEAFNPLRLNADTSIIALLSMVWITCGVAHCYKKRLGLPITAFGYTALYTLVHVLFPDRVLRYSYPITPFVYMLLFWPALIINGHSPKIQKAGSVLIMTIVTTVIVVSIWLNGAAYLETQRWIKAEKRFVAEWFNAHAQKPTVVYAFDFVVSKYYTDNPNVVYADIIDPHSWSDDLCTHPQDMYVVIDSYTEGPGYYFDYINGLNYFVHISQSKDVQQYLLLMKKISIHQWWARIYKVNKTKEGWCETLKKAATE